MLQPIGVLCCLAYLFPDVSSEMVTPKAVIMGLVSAVVAMAGGMAAMWLHATKTSKKHQEKVVELYEARINDLKEAHELVDTLIRVLKKGEGG